MGTKQQTGIARIYPSGVADLAWLITVAAVGLAVLVIDVSGDDPVHGPRWLWWTTYAVFVICMLTCERLLRILDARVVIALISALAMAICLIAPSHGFTGAILVVVAAVAASVLTTKLVLLLVAVQTIVTTVLSIVVSTGIASVVVQAFLYLGFQLFVVVMVDATEREVRARDELERVNAELRTTQAMLLASAQARERLRISRDLHDIVGHQLTALALELEVAAHQVQGDALEHVTTARRIAKESLIDLRTTVGQLRSTPSGIALALHEVVAGVSTPQVHLMIDDEVDFPTDEHSHVLVRCVQEILTNAVRHAHAHNLWINVSADGNTIRLVARDDGQGATKVAEGNGLLGMRERFAEQGGRVEYGTEEGSGFVVRASMPA